jgi:hypothetical protein
MHDVSKLSAKACGRGQKINIDGVHLTLTAPDTHEAHWIDYNDYLRQLQAAWLRLSDDELPLNPRIVGEPGLGKSGSARDWAGGLYLSVHDGYAA